MAFGRFRDRVIGVAICKEATVNRSGIIWTIVGVLLIIALLIYIF
jgi:hypothetical protein